MNESRAMGHHRLRCIRFSLLDNTTRPCHILTFQQLRQKTYHQLPLIYIVSQSYRVSERKAWRHRQAEHIKINIILYIPCCRIFSLFPLSSFLLSLTPPRKEKKERKIFLFASLAPAKCENTRKIGECERRWGRKKKICVVRKENYVHKHCSWSLKGCGRSRRDQYGIYTLLNVPAFFFSLLLVYFYFGCRRHMCVLHENVIMDNASWIFNAPSEFFIHTFRSHHAHIALGMKNFFSFSKSSWLTKV